MPSLETAEPEYRTPAQLEFDRLMQLWEGKPKPFEGQTEDGYYVEIAGGLIVALSDQLRDVRGESGRIVNLGAELEKEVAELKSAMNMLQPCPELPVTTLEAFDSKPTIRVRIQHSNTIKEGWRLSETTVEYSAETVDWNVIANELNQAYRYGNTETIARNDPVIGEFQP